MTVLPAPGGATSTPASWSARACEGLLLLRIEFCGELVGLRFAGGPFVGELQAAAGLFYEGCEPVLQPARQEWVAGECLVVVAQGAGCPRWRHGAVAASRRRVGHGCRVLECGEQRWGKAAVSTVILAPSRACTTAGGCTAIFVGVGERSRFASAPTPTWPSRCASRLTSWGVSRPGLDRKAHWSSCGSMVARSRNTVAPRRRARARRGAAVRMSRPPARATACGGESRA